MLRFCPMTKVGNIRRDTTGPIGTFHTQTKFWEKNASTAHPLTRAHLYSINLYTSMNNIHQPNRLSIVVESSEVRTPTERSRR